VVILPEMSVDREFGMGAFGNGAPWAAFADPPVTLPQLKALASWFLVLIPKRAKVLPSEMSHEDFDDSTGDITTPGQRRTSSGSLSGVGGPADRVVYPVRRSPRAQFPFVSLGRNEGNDSVRFGDIQGIVVDAAGLLQLLGQS
jgi:hypothetical protein